MGNIVDLTISYPDFKLNDLIDPEQFDINNFEITTKINEIILESNNNDSRITSVEADKADKQTTYTITQTNELLNTKVNTTDVVSLATPNRVLRLDLNSKLPTSVTGHADSTLASLNTHRASTDHNNIYYIKSEVDSKDSVLNAVIQTNRNNITTLQGQMVTHNHNTTYYTKTELEPFLRGGDTSVIYEIFNIINSNNGDGTFTYINDLGNTVIGSLTPEGHQIFTLTRGSYSLSEHISCIINDTLHRSVKSGGMSKINDFNFALTMPEGNGAEITVTYFERVGIAGEYRIIVGNQRPLSAHGEVMWFKVV